MGSSDIRIPQECMLLWLGNFSSILPYLCTCFETELKSCDSRGLVARRSSSSLGSPKAFPTSRKMDLYLNSTFVPQNATWSLPYFVKMYPRMVSLVCQLQSISKSGGVFRLSFKNL